MYSFHDEQTETRSVSVGRLPELLNALQARLQLLPVRHDLAQELVEFAAVVGVLEVAELVDDDVVDTGGGG